MIALYSRTKCKYLCNKQGLESKAKSRARTGTVQPPLFRPQCAHAHAEIGLVSLTHRHHVNDEKSGIHSLCAGPTMVQTDCCRVVGCHETKRQARTTIPLSCECPRKGSLSGIVCPSIASCFATRGFLLLGCLFVNQ